MARWRCGSASARSTVCRQQEIEAVVASRQPSADDPSRRFSSLAELQHRGGARVAALERLAAADAFRSLGLDRRQALWEVRALREAPPLPLFAWGERGRCRR